MLQTVEIEAGLGPGETPRASVIWLHGLGADGHDFEPIVPELSIPGLPLRFVFPHAPVRPVTLNGGLPMRAWFDIVALDRRVRQDGDGMRASAAATVELIECEMARGVPASRIVLAGFSQGGSVALFTGLHYPETLAGIMGLSTFLPAEAVHETEAANRETPIFLAHGELDPLVALDMGEHTRDMLVAAGHRVSWHSYPMAHAVCPQEVADIRNWLVETLRNARP